MSTKKIAAVLIGLALLAGSAGGIVERALAPAGHRLGAFPTFPVAGGGSGTVTSVSGTAPITVATGTTTPAIAIVAATTSVPGSMSAADKTKVNSLATASFTQSVGGLSIDVPVTAGDGLYKVELTATIAGGGALAVKLRVNGGALTTPFGHYIPNVGANPFAPQTAITDGTILSQGTFGFTTLLIQGGISIRSGTVCMYDMKVFATDGSAMAQSIAAGKHNPATTVTSIGFVIDSSTITAGSVLRATRIGD